MLQTFCGNYAVIVEDGVQTFGWPAIRRQDGSLAPAGAKSYKTGLTHETWAMLERFPVLGELEAAPGESGTSAAFRLHCRVVA